MSSIARKDALIVRELARIYGFPDDFVFYGEMERFYRYFALAVPPMIARKAAEVIRETIDRYTCRDEVVIRKPRASGD